MGAVLYFVCLALTGAVQLFARKGMPPSKKLNGYDVRSFFRIPSDTGGMELNIMNGSDAFRFGPCVVPVFNTTWLLLPAHWPT